MIFDYCWVHFKTGKSGRSSQKFENYFDFLKALNEWNRDHRWKYWY